MSSDTSWILKTRRLTQALIISGTVNIALLATFGYSVFKERRVSAPIELTPVGKGQNLSSESNEKLLRAYSLLPFQDLLMRLDNKDLIEDGYTRRDLALSCLVAFHHFNLERALGGLELQKRYVPFRNAEGEEQIPLAIFPGLADFQYEAILQYARTERWPLTPQGLFFEIQRGSPRDPTLLEAFYLTPQFHTVHLLFTRTDLLIEKEKIVEMLAEGNWNSLQAFTKEQRQAQDLSLDKRRAFLLSYMINCRSVLAAKILLEGDLEFVSKRLSDAELLTLFDLLPQNHPQFLPLARELIASPRCDAIWLKAASILYAAASEPLPHPYDHTQTLRRFAAAQLPPPPGPPPRPTPQKATGRVHTVQPGDSLWKIARQYKVSIESIKRQNHLESERLRPGKQLQIPER